MTVVHAGPSHTAHPDYVQQRHIYPSQWLQSHIFALGVTPLKMRVNRFAAIAI